MLTIARVGSLLLLGLLLTPGLGRAQGTVRIQDFSSGSLATVTPANALKVDGSAVTQPVSVVQSVLPFGSQDLGTGAAYFGGQSGIGSGGFAGPVPHITLFTPAGLIGIKATTAGFRFFSTNDGGASWGTGPAPSSFNTNPPTHLVLTTSTTPRYVLSASGDGTSSVFHTTSVNSAWARATGVPANVVTGLAAQGGTVLAVGSNTGATLTQACLSTNDGQAFSGCVTVDPAAASIPTSAAVPFVASPSPSIFITALNNGKIWRSTNNGAAWATVFTGSSQGAIVCLTALRCVVGQGANALVSTDAGATWAQTAALDAVASVVTLCPYDALTVTAIMTASWAQTNGPVDYAAKKSINGGLTWTPVPTRGLAMGADPVEISGPCTVSGKQTSFVMVNAGTLFTWYGGTSGPGATLNQSASRLDAAGLGVTATGASGAAVTATLPAISGAAHYIALLEIRQYAAGALTGGATPVVVTSTNLPGANAWTFKTALAIGDSEAQSYTAATPIKSAAQGVATTIVAPATTGVIWRLNVYYYLAP